MGWYSWPYSATKRLLQSRVNNTGSTVCAICSSRDIDASAYLSRSTGHFQITEMIITSSIQSMPTTPRRGCGGNPDIPCKAFHADSPTPCSRANCHVLQFYRAEQTESQLSGRVQSVTGRLRSARSCHSARGRKCREARLFVRANLARPGGLSSGRRDCAARAACRIAPMMQLQMQRATAKEPNRQAGGPPRRSSGPAAT